MQALFKIIFLLYCTTFFTGCATQRRQVAYFKEETLTPSYMPTNFTPNPIPSDVVSIAVLPLDVAVLEAPQSKALDAILVQELTKTTTFEVIPLSRLQCQKLFGAPSLSRTRPLPENALYEIHKETAAQAVLVGEVFHYKPYSPIQIGIRLAIIHIQTGEVLWAFEDHFDAGLATVAWGAQRYAEVALKAPYPFNENATMVISPRMFFQYILYESFKPLNRKQNLS